MKKLQRNILLLVASIVLGTSLMSYKVYAQGLQGLQPVQGLAVFDSKGTRVGNVLGFDGDFVTTNTAAVVAFTFDSTLIVVRVTRDFLEGPVNPGLVSPLSFESTNCSGTPFANVFV